MSEQRLGVLIVCILIFVSCHVASEVVPEAVPRRRPPIRRPVARDLLTVVEGCVIMANDGQMLGKITLNKYDTDSILNTYGDYGSK